MYTEELDFMEVTNAEKFKMDSTMKLCAVDFVIMKDEGETDMDSVQSKVCEDLIQEVLPFKHDNVNGEETQTDVKESNGDMCLQNITPINENDENQSQDHNNLNQKHDIKIADAKNIFWKESSYENASLNNEEDANSKNINMSVFKNSKHIPYNEELGTIQKLQHDNSFNKRLHAQHELNSKVTLFKHAPPKVKQSMSKDPHITIKDGHDTFNIGQFAADKDYDMNDNICKIENAGDCSSVCDVEVNQLMYRFAGGLFSSLRERPKQRRRWSLGEWNGETMKPEAELSRSQYSLVSCTDLTAGAVQLWLGLPEEVKYDPALAPFRQFYEKEHGKVENKKSSAPLKQRLPSVNSAPHLHNNQHAVREEPFGRNEKIPEKTDKLLEEDHETTVPKKTTVQKAQHYVKMTLLLACWVFFTTVFLMYNENEPITRNSSVAPGEVKHYPVTSGGTDRFSILLSLSGPFLSDTGEAKLNASAKLAAKKMEVWLERVSGNGDAVQTSDAWKLVLQEELDLDFSEGEPRSSTLRLQPYGLNGTSNVSLRIRTTVNSTTPFAMSYTLNPLDLQTGVLYASVLLFGLYVLIIFEVINRTMAAVLISTLALATLSIVGERPSLPEIVSWLDVETLLLLFSMMLLVAIMAETGMFDFLAVFTFEVTKGKLWPLISLLCTITAVLSTFLDNVTTVLLMTPVTIRLCEVMDLDPIPVLMSMVLFSNIGGTATPVGDPPNVIIASNKAVVQAGINFTNFTLHMTLGILLVCIQTYIQLRFIYRDTSKLRLKEPREIKDLRHQISIWRRAAESLPHMSRDEHVVRERLERKVKKLSVQLETLVKESNKRACPKDTFQTTLADMKEKYKIRDKPLLIKSTIAIGFVVTVFFLHSIPELNRVSLGWTALLGAILLLTLADREDLEPILHRVEWSTLLFFAALFVLMEALSKLGLIEFIGGLTERIILSVDESARLAVSILLMLWVSGITSAFVDNIPLTTMMIRVVTSLGSNPALNLPMAPLIWALSFGACLGGNCTLIGASANVVCAGVAEHHGYKFSFMQFFKIGFPIMIGHLIVASGYLLFCHCLFTWH